MQLDGEAPSTLPDDPAPEEWPAKGAVAMEGAVMRYRPELPTVLNSVSFSVRVPLCLRSDVHVGALVAASGSVGARRCR